MQVFPLCVHLKEKYLYVINLYIYTPSRFGCDGGCSVTSCVPGCYFVQQERIMSEAGKDGCRNLGGVFFAKQFYFRLFLDCTVSDFLYFVHVDTSGCEFRTNAVSPELIYLQCRLRFLCDGIRRWSVAFIRQL